MKILWIPAWELNLWEFCEICERRKDIMRQQSQGRWRTRNRNKEIFVACLWGSHSSTIVSYSWNIVNSMKFWESMTQLSQVLNPVLSSLETSGTWERRARGWRRTRGFEGEVKKKVSFPSSDCVQQSSQKFTNLERGPVDDHLRLLCPSILEDDERF